MNLLILESPGKVKKVQEILGPGWKVAASYGHVRDLPEKEFGVDEHNFFRIAYVPTDKGKSTLTTLANLAKTADEVFLAPDPDREGEAIAWHLATALGLSVANTKRVVYGEITESAIKAALGAPRNIDTNLVAAQEGRRVLDRFCGYMVSGPLSRALETKASAGRVQSPVLRLVVERERGIRAFTPTMHYGVEVTFEAVDNITNGWRAVWQPKTFLPDGQEYFLDKAMAERIASLRTLDVIDCQESEVRTAPPAPFTTSTLQQAASNSLKIGPKETMALAQKLYEGGHITYMRTDSPNLSQEAVTAIRAFCEEKSWPLVPSPRKWKSKEGAQEAHEAVRPTHIEVEEAGETTSEKALYHLIRLRTLATQLADAVFAVRILQLQGELDGKSLSFEARGRTLVSPGWKIVMATDQTEEADDEPDAENPVPALRPGSKATAVSGRLLTKKTKPAPRFSEAALIREMEKRGIGRPSTYAAIVEGIKNRNYVRLEKQHLAPTPFGEKVVDALVGKFGFLEFDFTRDMEASLDAIAEGKGTYFDLVSSAYSRIGQEVDAFRRATAIPCPECGSLNLRHLQKKASEQDPKEYDFFACPDCKREFPNVGGKPGAAREKQEKKVTEHKCPQCGAPMAYYHKPDMYEFLGCSNYPTCTCKVFFGTDGNPDFARARN